MGTCDSCLKFFVKLIVQTNFGVKRNMCQKCCEAANKCERLLASNPSARHRSQFEIKKAFAPKKSTNIPNNWLELYCKENDDQ